MTILGISCFYHDSAAVILRDGELLAAAEEERFSRIKHDFGFPKLAVAFCLQKAGITADDVDYVVFYEKPFLKFQRILSSVLQTVPRSWKLFREAMSTWLLDKLWIKGYIKDRIGIPGSKVLFVDHHASHAASAFLCSPFEEAALLTLDGVGEATTTAMGVGRGNQVTLQQEIQFPHSLGLLYSAFTAFLGFEVNEGEYKVMGMAPYGKPSYVDEVKRVIRLKDDGSFELDMRHFSFHSSPERTYNARFEKIFGKAWQSKDKETLDPYYADVAASIQAVTEEAILNLARAVHRKTGMKRLCLAGGVALNSVANARVLKETPFEEIYIQPAAGDSGGALGAALYVYHTLLGKPRSITMEHAYWGAEHTNGQVHDYLREQNLSYEELGDEALLDRVTDLLLQGRVVGWYQGRFEWGPRALGNRSILADARRPDMKDTVNAKIKFREPFRPFAPSTLAERTEEFFELPNAMKHYPGRFMLYVVPVVESKRDQVPAITHVDGTGRLQTVFSETNPRYHALISRFAQATGVPLVLNTSFNLKGEAIVNTPSDAYSTYARCGMDALVLGNCLLEKDKS